MASVTLWDGEPTRVATRFKEVRDIFRDHETFSSSPLKPGFPTLHAAEAAGFETGLLISKDPPEHQLIRNAVRREFAVRQIEARREETEALVDDLLEAMARTGPPVDLVKHLASPVPAQFTCALLGAPLEYAVFFARNLDTRADPDSAQASVYGADEELQEYFSRLVADRLESPGDDLTSRLVEQVRDGTLTLEQASKLLEVLLIGGFETTKMMIAMGTLVLLGHPDQLAELRSDPARWPAAIEELLRYLSVVQYERRVAIRPVDVGEFHFEKGDGVILAIHSANRDDDAFAEADAFDIHRPANNHVAFGSGIHQCLGQPVARMTLRVTFPRLFARFPGLSSVEPLEDLPYLYGRTIFGPSALPVTW
jgi:cytochrome P450